MLNYILQNEFKLYYCFKIRFFKSKSLRQTAVKPWGRKVNSICRKYQNNPAENK